MFLFSPLHGSQEVLHATRPLKLHHCGWCGGTSCPGVGLEIGWHPIGTGSETFVVNCGTPGWLVKSLSMPTTLLP